MARCLGGRFAWLIDFWEIFHNFRFLQFFKNSGQWKDMIAKLAKSGRFKRVQAVCDVSGSMEGIPMEVAIALGLVIAELTQPPFRGKIITFHDQPALHTIRGHTLQQRTADMSRMAWGNSTNLLAVFKLLLKEAQKKLNGSQRGAMVEQLFIFTDMQFDKAHKGSWAATYNEICQLYAKAGYIVPKIVFWNLRATHESFPVQKDDLGTALVSGFSANLMKAFLGGGIVEFNPMSVMNEVLDKYKITDIPGGERCPIIVDALETFPLVAAQVEEFLVAKKPPKFVKVKKRGGLRRPQANVGYSRPTAVWVPPKPTTKKRSLPKLGRL